MNRVLVIMVVLGLVVGPYGCGKSKEEPKMKPKVAEEKMFEEAQVPQKQAVPEEKVLMPEEQAAPEEKAGLAEEKSEEDVMAPSLEEGEVPVD